MMSATRSQQSHAEQSSSLPSPSVVDSPSPVRRPKTPNRPSSSSSAGSRGNLSAAASPKLRTSPSVRRANYNTITASAAAASVERLPRSSSPSVTLDSSPTKKQAPSRTNRDFEILLASDQTKILKDTLDPALPGDIDVDDADSFRSSSSLPRVEPTAKLDQPSHNTSTPPIGSRKFYPPRSDLFASPKRVPPPSLGAQGRLFNGSAQAPPSPDRTTSLQNHQSHTARAEAASSAAHRFYKAMPDLPPASAGSQFTNGHSMSLEQEVNATSSKLDVPDPNSSTVSFRQRMKKTSGFLRKLRGDSGQDAKEKASPSKPNASSSSANLFAIGNPSLTSMSQPMQSNLSSVGSFRRESIASTGASSTYTTNSASTSRQANPYISQDSEALLEITELPASTTVVPKSVPLSASLSGRRLSQHLTINAPEPSRRLPSAPFAVSEIDGEQHIILPQRSTSQGQAKMLSGSSDAQTTNAAIREFQTEMDDALKESPGVAETRGGFAANPAFKQQWGRSPQLPDLNIQQYKERNGSFLEDSDFAHTQARKSSVATLSSPEGIPIYPGTPVTATFLPARTQSNASGAEQALHRSNTHTSSVSDIGVRTRPLRELKSDPRMLQPASLLAHNLASDRAVSPIESVPSHLGSRRNSADSVQSSRVPGDTIHRTDATSGASLTSLRSFETAAESTDPASVDAKNDIFPYMSQSVLPTQSGPQKDVTKTVQNTDTGDAPYTTEGEDTVRNMHSDDEDEESQSIRYVAKASVPEAQQLNAPVAEQSQAGAAPLVANEVPTIAVLPTAVRQITSPLPDDIHQRAGLEDASTASVDLATKCWTEDPSFLKREKIAEWLGGLGAVNRSARTHYFAKFDFSGLRVDDAFRKLCEKLFLRAETQQIDRILAAFSERYVESNPDSVFGNADVVHSVVFSILLLNTDLHIAELQERMTRHQFVRNTMGAIAESNDDVLTPFDDGRSSFSGHDAPMTRSHTQRSDAAPSVLAPSIDAPSSDTTKGDGGARSSMALSTKGKQAEMEQTLKDIYAAVKTDRILLPTPDTAAVETIVGRPSGTFGGNFRKLGAGSDRMTALKRGSIFGIQGLLGNSNDSSGGLGRSVSSNNLLRGSLDVRGRSTTSLTPVPESNRSDTTLPVAQTPGFASTLSQTIISEARDEDAENPNATKREPTEEDDDNMLALSGPPWAKEGSLTRKFYWESPGKRGKDKNWADVFVVVSKGTLSMFRFDLTSAATKSRATGGGGAAMGGGNWLSSATCLGEMSLAHSLANALPPPGYNRARPHVFALTLASGAVYFFQAGHEELINEWVSTCNYWAGRTSKEPLPGGVSNMEYGWNKVLPPVDDYEELDSASFTDSSGRGTMTTSTSTGGYTASSARSNPPDASIYQGTTLLGQPASIGEPKRAFDSKSVKSHKSSGTTGGVGAAAATARSLRSRVYQNWNDVAGFVSASGSSTDLTGQSEPSIRSNVVGGGGSNERIFINDWRIPTPPSVPATLAEEPQLARLERQVCHIEAELTVHTSLRTPMLSLYAPKGANYAKCLANWERKSNWLLQELVKYGTYTEALRKSLDLKAEKKARREVQDMIEEADSALAQLHVASLP